MFTSCDKDDCGQECYVTQVTSGLSRTTVTTVQVCHNGQTLNINENALQAHLNHGDTEGPCQALSDGGLVYGNGEWVTIPCKYDLPLLHTDSETGAQYYYTATEQ